MLGLSTSNLLATGSGYGPADISLRPIFPLWDFKDAGNRQSPLDRANRIDRDGDADDDSIDDYATLLAGRAIEGGRYLRAVTASTPIRSTISTARFAMKSLRASPPLRLRSLPRIDNLVLLTGTRSSICSHIRPIAAASARSATRPT